jgi:hypothetical protein
MKILKTILISLIVLIIILILAAVIFVKTFDVNRFKPQIIAQANKALNRKVDFERAKLGISLRYGISLKIANLSIAEDPAFGEGEFLTVKEVSCGLNLFDYIFRKEVNVPGILIDSARITVIRKKDNTFNVQGITQSAKALNKTSVPAAVKTIALPALLINSLKGINSRVLYIDESFEPQLRLEITDLNFLITQISLTQAFPFVAEAAVLSTQKNIKVEGQINLADQDYNFTAGAKDLNIQELIAQDKSPVKAEGIVSGKLRLKGKGFSPQALTSSLSGDANILAVKLKLKNINVLRTVLDKISIIPGLTEKFEAGLPERFKQKLTDKDTLLSDIKLPVLIANGQCILNDVTFGADEFTFKGKGQVGFDATFLLEGAFLIPQDLSEAMVASVDKLQYLLNDSKQIYIPLKVSGKGADFKFSVDAEYIAKKLIQEEAQKQIFKFLDKTFGKEETEQPAPQNATAPSTPTEEQSSTQDSIKELLEGIFR